MIDIVKVSDRKKDKNDKINASDSNLIPIRYVDIKKILNNYNIKIESVTFLASSTIKEEFEIKYSDLKCRVIKCPSFSKTAGGNGEFGTNEYKRKK